MTDAKAAPKTADPSRARARHRARRFAPRSPRSRGAIMVITLLAIILLASLIFYVMNLGQSTSTRIRAQHAADTTAIGGAAWVARTFNLVALNNTSMARSIAIVNVLDPLPRAINSTLIDQRALQLSLEAQLARGVPGGDYMTDSLEMVLNTVNGEVEMLDELDAFFNRDGGFDITRITHYNSPDGIGAAWRSMHAMDELSQAAMSDLAAMTQVNATAAGLVNLRGEDSLERGALLLPVVPSYQWRRGTFEDFQRPVQQGLLPQAIDDLTTNRGPWDAVYGWRIINYTAVGGGDGGGDGGGADPPRGNVPIGSGGPGSRGRNPNVDYEPVSYRAFGPQRWVLHRMAALRGNDLRYSRFSSGFGHNPVGSTFYWLNHMASINFEYLWPGTTERQAIEPEWEASFPTAVNLGEAGDVNHTRFLVVEIKSRYARTDPRFLTPGSWAHFVEENYQSPRVVYSRGWLDPRAWGVEQPAQYVWRDEWNYTTTFDPEIGIEVAYDEDGFPIQQPVYRIDHFVFAGVEHGDESPVRNPHNFTDRSALPAPLDFDHSQVSPNPDRQGMDQLTFLGIAQQRHRAIMWPGRFTSASPYPYAVGIAQAGVFNNHSFDLWTQMWHAQLERVEPLDEWISVMRSDAGEAGRSTDLSAEQYDALQSYLESVEPLSELMLTH